MVIITHDFSKKNKFSIIIPIFFSNPAFKVGIPVLRTIFCFTCAIPNALFHEKEKPRIPVFVFLPYSDKIKRLITLKRYMESFQPIIFSYRLVIKCHPSRTQSTREEPTIIIIQSCKLKPQTLKNC